MKIISLVFLICILVCSCSSNDDDKVNANCTDSVIIDNELFRNSESDNYSITNATIVDDCLELTIGASGCDGNSWQVQLIDADRVAESNPVQRDVKILLKTNEDCTGFFQRSFSFNIAPIQTADDVILINLENWDSQLRYQF